MGWLRELSAPFVALGPTGVAVRTRLKDLSPGDEEVLALVGAHLGSLASKDLRTRCADGLEHSGDTWAVRKRELTALSSSRWAGAITKATHDQWALARRGQAAHVQNLEAGVKTIEHRLSLPVGEKGSKRAPGGYRGKREWFAKARRLQVLQDRLDAVRADREAGRVR
ncbi:transposase, partial [Streptomyces sp. ISL-94]|nr:transposase [Streptomyces sp. ISL-94]